MKRTEICPHKDKKDIFDIISPYKEKRTKIGRPAVLHIPYDIIRFPLLNELIFCSATPPYYSIFLFMLDLSTVALPVVGLLFYSNKIAPPDLIATMAAVASVFFWTIGTGRLSFC